MSQQATQTFIQFESQNLSSLENLGWSREGYDFVGWNENKNATTAQYTDSQNIHLDGIDDKTLYAIWKKKTYTVKLDVNNNDYGEIIGANSGTYDYGTVLNISAVAKTGYVFSQWNSDIGGEHLLSTKTITVNQNIDLLATFAEDNIIITYEDNIQ